MDDERNTTGSSTYHVDKLTETNYRSWAQQLRWILDERDLWELVEGTERKPEPPVVAATMSTTGEPTGVQTTQATKEYQEQRAAWTKKAKKAHCLKGGQTRHPNHEPAKDRKSEALGRVHSDLCG